MQRNLISRRRLQVVVLLVALPVFTLSVGSGLLAESATKQPPTRPVAPLAPSECDGVAGNLIMNCGFETGSFGVWTFTGVDPANNFVSTDAAHSGTYGAAMGSVGGLGCISQPVATTAGVSYTLSFWLANLGGTPTDFQVWFGPTGSESLVAGDLFNLPAFNYTKFTIGSLTGSGADTVYFCAQNDPAFFLLDDVVLVH